MANYVYLTLDTSAPTTPSILLASGAVYATTQVINADISVGDADKTGFEMLIWGDVDTSYNAKIQSTMGASQWMAYSATQSIKVSTGDGNKTINMKVRDSVWNETTPVSDTIQLDTSSATVSLTTPDLPRISKVSGRNVSSFTFSSDKAFSEYKVKVVSAIGDIESLGTVIPTTAGSTNTSGTAGNYAASTPITVQINGADFETAGASTGVQKIIKVFVKDMSGKWSA